MARGRFAKVADLWRPAEPSFRRWIRLGLIAAGILIATIAFFHPSSADALLPDALAWALMTVVMVAANLERQRRALSTRITGHQLMLAGIVAVYGVNTIGHLGLLVTGRPHATWVYDFALIAGIIPLAIGLVRLSWPPGTTVRETAVIAADALMAACSLSVLWILIVVPAHVANDEGVATALARATPWAQFAALLAVVIVAASSRRAGSLPVPQLILVQASVIAFVAGDIIEDVMSAGSPLQANGPLVFGAWLAALLYTLFAQRPAMEDEGPRQHLARLIWSASVPAFVLIIMGISVGAFRLLIGPMPDDAVFFTLIALVTASLVITVQRILLIRDLQASRMLRVRASLEESAKAQWFSAVLGDSHDLVTVVDHQGRVVFQTPAITTLFGYPAEKWADAHASAMFEEVTEEQLNRVLLQSLHEADRVPVEMVIVDVGGEPRETETVVIPLRADGADGYVLTTRDVTDRLRLRAALAESGQRDQLTGLNNRDGFLSRLRQVMPSAHERLAVVLLDIVNFRDINDSRGHAVGDALLRAVASAMDRLPPSVVVAARIGADEFAMVVIADNVEREVGQIDHILRDAMRRIVADDGPALDVEFRLGYVTRLPVNDSATALMERADLALAAARTTGSRTAVRYERGMRSALVNRLRREEDLRQALDSDRLMVYYQPIIDLDSGRIASVEALVRMRSLDGGLIPPDQFIPQAEELGLIDRLGIKVLDVALGDIPLINSALGRDITVAVNFSAAQIKPDLPGMVSDRLRSHSLDGRALTVEVTESSLVQHTQSATILGALREMGCQIAIDDFGTGYSSLSYLVGLPVDELKIDRSFVGRLADSHRSLSLVRVLLQMAATLGLEVVAEGVETVEQADLLRGMGCPRAQGYLYAAPMPLQALLEAVAGPKAAFRYNR